MMVVNATAAINIRYQEQVLRLLGCTWELLENDGMPLPRAQVFGVHTKYAAR